MNLSIQILIALILSVVAGLAAGSESLPFINQWIAPIGGILFFDCGGDQPGRRWKKTGPYQH